MDKMERNILDLLERGPVVADGKLECAIVEKLKLTKRPATYRTVIGKLERLEEKGKAVIERNGSVLRGVKLAPSVRAALPNYRVEDEEAAAEMSRIEALTEVNLESDESERLVVDVVQTTDKDPIWKRLSLALLALQMAASPDGRLTGSSAQIIARELSIKIDQANALNGRLAKLGLRQTSGSKSNTVHQINMTKKEVTEEDLYPGKVVAQALKSDSAAIESEIVPIPDAPIEGGVDLTDAPASPDAGPRSIIEQMADVIEILEKKNESLGSDKLTLEKRIENQRLELLQKDKLFDDEGAKTARIVTRLTADLTAANAKIDDLQEQVSTLTAPPSERINELLARHLKSASGTPS